MSGGYYYNGLLGNGDESGFPEIFPFSLSSSCFSCLFTFLISFLISYLIPWLAATTFIYFNKSSRSSLHLLFRFQNLTWKSEMQKKNASGKWQEENESFSHLKNIDWMKTYNFPLKRWEFFPKGNSAGCLNFPTLLHILSYFDGNEKVRFGTRKCWTFIYFSTFISPQGKVGKCLSFINLTHSSPGRALRRRRRC